MSRTREAVDAPMLAAARRSDRAVEGNVRRIVPGDDGPRRVPDQLRLQRRRSLVVAVPAIVDPDAFLHVIAARCIGASAAAFEQARIGGGGKDAAHEASIRAFK